MLPNTTSLIDNESRNFLYNILHKCHLERVSVYTTLFNIIIFIIFISVFGIALYSCYKQKLTPEEIHQKMLRDQAYVFSKIKYYQTEREKSRSITNLPWASAG